tara:strand:- start:2490 stop:3755 length:1266 start_codon:yes stop_codon:yes gene_type:complete
MTSINDTHRAMAKASLAMMAQVYDDVVKSNKVPANGAELYSMMTEAIFQDEVLEVPISLEKSTKIEKPTKIIEKRPSNGGVLAKDVKNAVKEFSYKPQDAKRAHRLALPYLPEHVDYSHTCPALELQGGLLTPCMTRCKKGELYCTGCLKSKCSHGTISNREDSTTTEFVNPAGKKAITYGTYLAIRDVPREFVESWISEKFGDKIIIPHREWNVDEAAVAKSKHRERSPSTSSDEEGEAPKKRGRGRPKKVVQDVVATPSPSPVIVQEIPTPETEQKNINQEEKSETKEVVALTPEPVKKEYVAPTPEPENVSNKVESTVSTNFTVIKTKDDQEFISVTENTDEEFEFVHRIRVKSTGTFYGIDEDGCVFTISGESAPLVSRIEDCDLEDGITWDETEEKLVFDEEENLGVDEEENSGNE